MDKETYYIEITNRCNMNCIYCAFEKGNKDNNLENIINEFKEIDYKNFSDIVILGAFLYNKKNTNKKRYLNVKLK